MFKKNYTALDDETSNLNAPLMSADFGTGSDMEGSSSGTLTSKNTTLPAYNQMYPQIPKPTPTYSSATGPIATNMEPGTITITCYSCTSMNKIPATATVIKCGVCSTINRLSQSVESTPTTMSCPTCTAHHNILPNTPPGSMLICSICEGISSEFTVVPNNSNRSHVDNPFAVVASTPSGPTPSTNTMPPPVNSMSLPVNDKIIICTGCTTRNRIPTGTPPGARLKCGVCSTLNNIPATLLPTLRAGRSCSVTSNNLHVICVHCHTHNGIPNTGDVIPQRMRCGKCHKVNGIPKIC